MAEAGDFKLLSVKKHFDACTACHVVDALAEQRHNVLVELSHAKPFKIRPKLYLGVGRAAAGRHHRREPLRHVVLKLLLEQLLCVSVDGLNMELQRIYVAQLGTQAVSATTGSILVVVVVVVAGHHVPKYQLRHKHLLLGMHPHRNALSVVGYCN